MDFENRGAFQLVAFAGAILVVLGVAVVAGFALADDEPTGTEVLSDIEEQYESADSLLVEGTVTAEYNDTVRAVDVHAVATSDGQFRANVTNGSEYVLAGYSGNTTWFTDSETGATVVISGGPAAPGQPSVTGLESGALPAGTTDLTANGSASVWVYGLDNATLDALAEDLNRSDDGTLNRSAIAAMLNGSSDRPALHNWSGDGPMAHNWSGDGEKHHNWSEAHNWSDADFDRENASVSTVIEETNLTAERVETTSLDGQEVHVVSVTHPDHEGELRVWATADTATVVKYRATSPNGTVTVDISQTRFDVSPAASTFQPPIASQSDQTVVDTVAELQATATHPVAVPDDSWTFQQGSVVANPVDATVAQYQSGSSTLAVVQSPSSRFAQVTADGRTVEVGDRTVTVTEIGDDRTMAQWSEGDQTVVVTGDVSESELLDAVRGMELVAPDA